MSVRVGFGIAQFGCDAVLKLFRDEMLQSLRLFVNLVPGVIQNIVQEAFEQAMVANHFQGTLSAGTRKAHSMVLFIKHERRVFSRQLLKHPRYGSRPNSETHSQRIARYRCFFRAAQLKDRLEVIVDRLSTLESGVFRGH